jgi:hypothetical protein
MHHSSTPAAEFTLPEELLLAALRDPTTPEWKMRAVDPAIHCIYLQADWSGVVCELLVGEERVKEKTLGRYVMGTSGFIFYGTPLTAKYLTLRETHKSCADALPCLINLDGRWDVLSLTLPASLISPPASDDRSREEREGDITDTTHFPNGIVRHMRTRSDTISEELLTPVFRAVFACRSASSRGRSCHLRHGQAFVQFRNGDLAIQRWADGDLVGIEAFVCSPTCPSPDFAGRWLGVGLSWRVSWFDLHNDDEGWRDNAYWPEGESKDVDLFWRYVMEGHIGWSADARSHAVKCAQEQRDGTNVADS